MKKYRVVYWLGSMVTEKYVKAYSLNEVKELFKEKTILQIEEV